MLDFYVYIYVVAFGGQRILLITIFSLSLVCGSIESLCGNSILLLWFILCNSCSSIMSTASMTAHIDASIPIDIFHLIKISPRLQIGCFICNSHIAPTVLVLGDKFLLLRSQTHLVAGVVDQLRVSQDVGVFLLSNFHFDLLVILIGFG